MLQRNFTFREDPSRIKLTKVPLLQQWGNNLFFHFFQKTGVYFSLLLSYLSPSLHRSIKDIKFKEPKFNPHKGINLVPLITTSLPWTLKPPPFSSSNYITLLFYLLEILHCKYEGINKIISYSYGVQPWNLVNLSVNR